MIISHVNSIRLIVLMKGCSGIQVCLFLGGVNVLHVLFSGGQPKTAYNAEKAVQTAKQPGL